MAAWTPYAPLLTLAENAEDLDISWIRGSRFTRGYSNSHPLSDPRTYRVRIKTQAGEVVDTFEVEDTESTTYTEAQIAAAGFNPDAWIIKVGVAQRGALNVDGYFGYEREKTLAKRGVATFAFTGRSTVDFRAPMVVNATFAMEGRSTVDFRAAQQSDSEFHWTGRATVSFAADQGDLFFADNGGTFPNYGGHMLPSLYDSSNDRTYHAWEGWDDSSTRRLQYLSWYDHTSGFTGPVVSLGFSGLIDDDHGNPSIALDHEGHMWAFYGSHASAAGSEAKISSTRWPIANDAGEGSLFAVRPSHSGQLTYPKPHAIGTKLYVGYRKTVSGSHPQFVIFDGTPSSGEVSSWTETVIANFGGTNRFYAGNTIVRGSEIHFTAAVANSSDTTREHVYYFIYDTADGSLSNWNKSTTVAAGSLPVSLTTANSSFRIFAHSGGNHGTIAFLAFDTNGNPHVTFTDGQGSSFNVKHITVEGSPLAWTTPETIVSGFGRDVSSFIGPLPDGEMEAFMGGSPTGRYRRVRSAAGVWGSPQPIFLSESSFASVVVRDAHIDARVVFAERAANSLDASAGGLRLYMWGDGGLISRNEEAAEVPQAIGNLTLGTDNLTLGSDNLVIDTTE